MTKYDLNEITTKVKKFGTGSAHITVPGSWIGKMVKVTIIEEDDKE